MKLTSRQRLAGEMLPPWYYGLAYEDFARAYQIFYPIPFNYIVRSSMWIHYFWDKARSRPTWFNKQIEIERDWIRGVEYEYYQRELRVIGSLVISALRSSTGELTSADFHPDKAKRALGKIQEIMRRIETGQTGPT